MTSKASTLLFSVMSSIDEIKDKINDGEYLNLCNLLKSLNDELKTPAGAIESNFNDQREEESEGEEYEQTQLELIPRINHFLFMCLNNPQYIDNAGNPNILQILDEYNNLLLTIEEEHTETNNYLWFECRCGCSVRTSDISEHIATSDHTENFNLC